MEFSSACFLFSSVIFPSRKASSSLRLNCSITLSISILLISFCPASLRCSSVFLS
nr:MAG TPA: hypothetical protein [Caudoviricetes sp.]